MHLSEKASKILIAVVDRKVPQNYKDRNVLQQLSTKNKLEHVMLVQCVSTHWEAWFVVPSYIWFSLILLEMILRPVNVLHGASFE